MDGEQSVDGEQRRAFNNDKFSKEPLGWGLVSKGSTLVKGKLNKSWT